MDVARYAKVSKMTVSRVLSGNGYVKEDTRQAVLEAVQALQYRPNLLAKSFATGRTNIIAYVLPDIGDPMFGHVCRGTTDTCRKLGYSSIVANADSEQSLQNIFDMLVDRKVDGVIFHHLNISQEQIDSLQQKGIHCALIDNETELTGVVRVDNHHYQGAAMAARYLVERGYKKITCVQGGVASAEHRHMGYTESFRRRIWQQRTQGFLDALSEVGMKPFGICTGRSSGGMEQAFLCGQQIMQEILKQPERPDAIYCESDTIALGLLGEMLESKVSCPEEIALCGYDGLDMCRCLYPRITTVVQPQYEIGTLAAEHLIAVLSEEEEPTQIKVSPSLFIGDTTG